MRRFWRFIAEFAYRRWSEGLPEPVGVPFRRDPEAPCTAYEPRKWKLQDWDDCETDGHYLCGECCHRKGHAISEVTEALNEFETTFDEHMKKLWRQGGDS